MRKEKPLYILLGVLFFAYVIVEYYSPKPIDWTITYSEKDKNPFGSYILFDRIHDMFPHTSISFQTLPEAVEGEGNVFILSHAIWAEEVEIAAIFQILSQGRSVFIGAQSFSRDLLDTLGIDMYSNTFDPLFTDSISVHFSNKEAYFPATIVNTWFEIDSLQGWKVHGKALEPVLISKNFGNGKLILSSTPLVFTNYAMLQKENHQFVAEALNLLPYENLLYSRYYQSGRPEAKTPLRYMLSVAPLRWAVYLSLLVLLLYLIVNSRRFQRFIPLMEPPKNATVQFIKTIGGLYFREGNHKNAALKIINHFMKGLAEKYHLGTFDEKAYPVLASKTGVPLEDVVRTFSLINSVKQAHQLSEESLKSLYEKIKMFKI